MPLAVLLRSVRPLALALGLVVAGCATEQASPARPAPIARADVAVPAPARVASEPAVASAVAVPPLAPPAALPVAPTPVPYTSAVAARFPDPPVAYDTPAFRPGHDGYTSNAELAEALRALVAQARSRGVAARLEPVGISQSGTPIEAIVIDRGGDSAAAAVARPAVLLVGQQHGDEPAGAEALLAIAQRLVRGPLTALLDRIQVVILPRANPDGAEAGRRTTASGIDVNRDHLLLRTPEAQAQARLVREFRPLVVVDAHEHTVVGRYLEKFGAIQRYDVLLQYATTANLPEFVTKASEEWFREPMLLALDNEGLSHQWYYTTNFDRADKRLSMGGVQPDTARNVQGLRNAVSLLVESRGAGIGRLHFVRRVHTQVVVATSVLRSAAARASDLQRLRQFVDQDVAAQACRGDMLVEAGPTRAERTILMIDPDTGADKPVSVAWDSALQLQPRKVRSRPCGYWLAADQGDAVRRLRELGVGVQQFTQQGTVRGETYNELGREVGARADVRGVIADAAASVRVTVEPVPALIDAPAGSFFVPLTQPLGNLVVAALEPDTQNSFFAAGIVPALDREARLLALPEAKLDPVP